MDNEELKRLADVERRRLAALRSPEVRKKISDRLKGKTPDNFQEMQQKGWAANRKKVLTYSGIHAWAKRNWGKAHCCEMCGKKDLAGRKVHWANKDHKYSRDRNDWMMVCRPCHAKWDTEHNLISFATKRAMTTTHCPQGHEYTADNTYTTGGSRKCKQCARERFQRTYVKKARVPKTHCKRGHELTPENMFTAKDGNRECRLCRNERVREWKKRNRKKET